VTVAGAGITNATAVGYAANVTQSNSLVLGSINGVGNGQADTNVGIRTTAPHSQLHVNGSMAIGVRTTSAASTTILANDCMLIYTGGAGSSIFLPTAVGITGRMYIVKNRTANALNLFTISNQTIDGVNNSGTALTINGLGVVKLVSDGANWQRLD